MIAYTVYLKNGHLEIYWLLMSFFILLVFSQGLFFESQGVTGF